MLMRGMQMQLQIRAEAKGLCCSRVLDETAIALFVCCSREGKLSWVSEENKEAGGLVCTVRAWVRVFCCVCVLSASERARRTGMGMFVLAHRASVDSVA